MPMNKLKVATRTNSVRILTIFISSIIFTMTVNAFLPSRLPLLITDGKRPGIPVGSWNELRYIDARKAYEMVSTGQGILIDIRVGEDYDKSHPSGAINVP